MKRQRLRKTVNNWTVMKLNPCSDWPEERVKAALPSQTRISDFLRLQHIPPHDRLWVALHTLFLTERMARLFCANVAALTLRRIDRANSLDGERSLDRRLFLGIERARAFARSPGSKQAQKNIELSFRECEYIWNHDFYTTHECDAGSMVASLCGREERDSMPYTFQGWEPYPVLDTAAEVIGEIAYNKKYSKEINGTRHRSDLYWKAGDRATDAQEAARKREFERQCRVLANLVEKASKK